MTLGSFVSHFLCHCCHGCCHCGVITTVIDIVVVVVVVICVDVLVIRIIICYWKCCCSRRHCRRHLFHWCRDSCHGYVRVCVGRRVSAASHRFPPNRFGNLINYNLFHNKFKFALPRNLMSSNFRCHGDINR